MRGCRLAVILRFCEGIAQFGIPDGQLRRHGLLVIGIDAKIMRAPKHDFVTLDGLRGVAAIAIVTRHVPAFFPPGRRMLQVHYLKVILPLIFSSS